MSSGLISNTETYQTGWPGVVNVCVTSESLRKEMIEVRRAAYASWGLDLPVTDIFDECPHTTAFLLKEHGRAVGTIRLTVRKLDTNPVTPSRHIFGGEIAGSLATEAFVDISRLAMISPAARCIPDYCFALFQNASAAADENGSRYLLAPTRADHRRIYEGMGFRQIGPARPLTGWLTPVIPLALDWTSQRSHIASHRRYRKVFRDQNPNALAA